MLKVGDRFRLSGRVWRVTLVNASRAHCVSEAKEQVTMMEWNKKLGQRVPRTFTATSRDTIDISPNAPVEKIK